MSWKCGLCGYAALKGMPETRHTEYREREGFQVGREIAREIKVCNKCLTRLNRGESISSLLEEQRIARLPVTPLAPTVSAPPAPSLPAYTPVAATPLILGQRVLRRGK